MNDVSPEEWLRLMDSYPSDGWDGAAAVIAEHDRKVRLLEQALDEVAPGWYERLDARRRRRTKPVSP